MITYCFALLSVTYVRSSQIVIVYICSKVHSSRRSWLENLRARFNSVDPRGEVTLGDLGVGPQDQKSLLASDGPKEPSKFEVTALPCALLDRWTFSLKNPFLSNLGKIVLLMKFAIYALCKPIIPVSLVNRNKISQRPLKAMPLSALSTKL